MDIDAATEALHAERERLQRDLDNLRAPGSGHGGDTSERLDIGQDDAVTTYADELDDGMIEEIEASFEEIDEALKRVGEGTYGTCVSCGSAIPEARLAALPATARCIDCQRREEHR